MAAPTVGRRARMAAAVMLLALFGTLIPLATVSASVVNPATGGSAISADEFGTSSFTTLAGPQIAESAAGELALGTTTTLNIPSGFRFNTGAGNVSIGGTGCNLTGTLSVTATQATFTVTAASTVATCVVTFIGLQVQPTGGSGLTSGTISKTGSSSAPGGATNYGSLTKVAGAVTELIYLTQPTAVNNGGTPFGGQPRVLARDQFGNPVAGAPVTLSITPGTGTTGGMLTCDVNPLSTDGAGVADFKGHACAIDLAGSYRLRASDGSASIDSGTFTVNIGPAREIRFASYPAGTTPATLTPQPAVAVTDAGGNIVVSSPPTDITLAINKAAGSFSCTGGLVATTANGVATWAGCVQSTADTGYQLTAAVGFATVTGDNFAVTQPGLAFIAGPGAPAAGQPFPTNVQVAIQNGGATISGVSAAISLAIGANPSGGVLTCTGGTAVATSNGVATFTGCSIDRAGSGYTLVATASNVVPAQALGPGTSLSFDVGTALPPPSITLDTFCGTPSPKSTTGPNQCAPDTSKSPPQANINLPQTLDEGVWLQAHIATNGANRLLTFEVSKDHLTWSTIGTATTDGSGSASVFYRPSDNRYYRANFAGAADFGPGASPEVRVVVRALVFIRPTGCTASSPCHVRPNGTVTFTVTARPNRPELPPEFVQYVIQRKTGSTWVTVVTDAIPVSKATGTASFVVTFNVKGTWRLRANLEPTSVNANSFPTDYDYYSAS